MKKVYFFICLFLNGCVTYSVGYLPNQDKIPAPINIEQKRDITFSVSYTQEILDNGVISPEDMRDKLKKALKETGLFNKIHYVHYNNKSSHHFNFDIFVTGTEPAKREDRAMASAITIFIIPFMKDYNIDFSMSYIVDDKVLYSTAAAEQVTDFYWLPAVVFSPFLNHGTVGYCVERKSVKYFINEIIENKLY